MERRKAEIAEPPADCQHLRLPDAGEVSAPVRGADDPTPVTFRDSE